MSLLALPLRTWKHLDTPQSTGVFKYCLTEMILQTYFELKHVSNMIWFKIFNYLFKMTSKPPCSKFTGYKIPPKHQSQCTLWAMEALGFLITLPVDCQIKRDHKSCLQVVHAFNSDLRWTLINFPLQLMHVKTDFQYQTLDVDHFGTWMNNLPFRFVPFYTSFLQECTKKYIAYIE